MYRLSTFGCTISLLFVSVFAIPASLLYKHEVREAVSLPRGHDLSSREIKLQTPIIFYGIAFESIFVNLNGILSFQTEIPTFFNIEFPLDYPVISPFYSHVDTTIVGSVSYYQTNDPEILSRATENIHDSFSIDQNYQPQSVFIVTWKNVGYFKKGSDKNNTYQVAVITDGVQSYVEFLYPENGINWIQGSGDESGLPDARAQAGFVSPDGNMFTLPGSGTEQVFNLEKWSNMKLDGQWIYRIDDREIIVPDQNNEAPLVSGQPVSCSKSPTYCHVQAECIDYTDGFCCKCKKQYYGNGKFCIKKDVPLRVNGKVNGKINGEKLENLDLQSYIVMTDGRAYTAISKIPESIADDIQSLQILGGVIGFLFAKPVKSAMNGYQITGGVFNQTATATYYETNQTVHIKQKYYGLDVFDQLKLDVEINGEIPTIPKGSKVTIDEYQEEYTLTSPGTLQMTSTRSYKYIDADGKEITNSIAINQAFLYEYCKYDPPNNTATTWKLKVGKNFISYESREQIVRFGLSNKIIPLGDYDPCDEGRSQCSSNSACVVDNDSFKCVCNPGYQNIYSGNGTVVCTDVNECESGNHDCDYNADCVNQVGSYTCTCRPGFEGNGHVCVNSASCANVRCTENAQCEEVNSIAMCKCLPGFTGDGFRCSPLENLSCHISNNCSPYGICAINPETNNYGCACIHGYIGDGYSCIPGPPTTTEPPPPPGRIAQTCVFDVCFCQSGYTVEEGTNYCVSLEGDTTTMSPSGGAETEVQCYNSTLCFCSRGYEYIKHLNICKISPENTNSDTKGFSGTKLPCNVRNNCNQNAQCIFEENSQSYVCVCNEGYEGDGIFCDHVSCTTADNCDSHATCTYSEAIGKSRCICNPGFNGDGYTCYTAICSSNDDCSKTEECIFTQAQRYECICKEGYTRDSQNQCVLLKGSCGGGTCVTNAECLYDNTFQTYYCSCKAGFEGDGITECKPRQISCNEANNCGENAICHYNEQTTSYECKCLEGFTGDGYKCATENNCHIDPSLCDKNAICIAEGDRKYVCQCVNGYHGNGTVCKEKRRHEGSFLLLNQGMATLKIPFEASKTNPGKAIQIQYYQTAVGLDVDCLEGRVYWSDITGRAIRSSSYNGSDKSDFLTEDIGSPEGLAIDWVSRNVYWTDSAKDTIELANIDSKARRVLVKSGLVNPRGIAVHPQRGKIFWTDWNRINPRIEWANTDGTGREVFLSGEAVSLPNSLTIDYETDHLCYADAGTKKIECVHISSRQKQTIAINCQYPFGISVTDKHIYWSDWILKVIERVDKLTLKRLEPLKVPLGGSGNKLYGLVAVPEACPVVTNVCQYYKNQCPEERICVPNGIGGRSCI